MVKFTVSAKALNEALATVAIVPPRPVTPQGGSGFLFVVKEGATEGHVYSRDATHGAMASFPVDNVEGDGSFIYPAKHIDAFGYLGDETLTITATSEGDSHKVVYATSSGAGAERSTYDPRLMKSLDADLGAAVNERVFPVAILKEALTSARPFLLKATESTSEEAYKALQLFDGKGELAKANGYLYATNGTIALFFRSEPLFDKGLNVHGQHLPMVLSFLGKAEGKVTIKDGASMSFVIDERGRALGWAHFVKKHTTFSYYGASRDNFVATVPPSVLLNALKYVKAELDSKQSKIRVKYDAAEQSLSFHTVGVVGVEKATSFPVPIVTSNDYPDGWAANYNLTNLIELFSGAKGNELEMRAYIVPPSDQKPRGQVMLRTVDEYVLDGDGKVVGGSGVETVPEGANTCRVTRFLSSME